MAPLKQGCCFLTDWPCAVGRKTDRKRRLALQAGNHHVGVYVRAVLRAEGLVHAYLNVYTYLCLYVYICTHTHTRCFVEEYVESSAAEGSCLAAPLLKLSQRLVATDYTEVLWSVASPIHPCFQTWWKAWLFSSVFIPCSSTSPGLNRCRQAGALRFLL